MSALDIAARGLARRALDTTETLQGAAGSGLLGHKRSEAGAILEPVSNLLKRLDMSPAGFGALYNAGTSDYAALQALTSAMASAAQGLVKLDPKTITLGQSSSLDRLNWSQSNAGLVGAGIDRTIIRNVHTATTDTWAMYFDGACENAFFSDMTFHGRVGCYSAANSLKSIVFNRCKFTTTSSVLQNAVQFVTDTMTSGVQSVFFIDCIFENPGRMGVEIQNHGSGTTVRYANLHFIRPRFIGAGQASASLGMGISLSGYGDTVVLDRPWFDGNKHQQLENVGCSRLRIRDMMVRASTLPTDKRMMVWSNTKPMYDCEVDGLTLVGELQADIAAEPTFTSTATLTTATPFYINNAVRPRFSRIRFKLDNTTSGALLMSFGQNNACTDVSVTDCVLTSSSNNALIETLSCTGNHMIAGNTLTSTAAGRTAALVGCYGSGTAHVSRNRISYSSGSAASVFAKSGSATFNVTPDNPGITTQYRAVHTIAAGQTSSTLANHGLPGLPARFRCWPRGNTGGAVWASNHTTNTQIRANIPAALAAAVDVEVEAEYAW